jgi:GNAT superfamily N-acetyltransferase
MNIKNEKTPEDFQYMEKLELNFYSEEHVTPWEEAYLWNLSNPKTGFVLEDCGRIVAFTDILPIRQELFDRILSGEFNDKYLKESDLVAMDELKEGDRVNLLLSCVLVVEDYRETDALKTLLNAHLDYYRSYVDRGIQIDAVVTSNVTTAGERFSERMGFERVGRSEHLTTIYKTKFRQFDERVREMKSKLETSV